MKKEHVLQDFAAQALSQQESEAVKGGRANTLINTGSFGFVDWGDVEIRNPNLVSANAVASWSQTKRLG